MAIKKKPFILPTLLTQKQVDLANSIKTKDLTITYGSAGTGKSFIPAVYAAQHYHSGQIDRIVLVRPTVPVGRGLGYLPGDLEEKMAPWMFSFIRVLEDYLSSNEVDCMLKNGKIEIVPLDVLRGRTWDRSFVVLDESQNINKSEIKAFLTRIGNETKVVINGDFLQSDIKETSGLEYIVGLLKNPKNSILASKVGLVAFESKDIVRSDMCKLWVEAFEDTK